VSESRTASEDLAGESQCKRKSGMDKDNRPSLNDSSKEEAKVKGGWRKQVRTTPTPQ